MKNKLRIKTAAALLALGGAAAVLPGCGGVYADSSGRTCVIVLLVPICNG